LAGAVMASEATQSSAGADAAASGTGAEPQGRTFGIAERLDCFASLAMTVERLES